MAKIGSLLVQRNSNTGALRAVGHIKTLTFQSQIVFTEVRDRTGDDAPAFEISTPEGINLGAAWAKETAEGELYYSIMLDDPSFSAALNCAAFRRGEAGGFEIVWNRPKGNGKARAGGLPPLTGHLDDEIPY